MIVLAWYMHPNGIGNKIPICVHVKEYLNLIISTQNGIKENDATPIALNATREFKMTLQNFTTLHSFQLLVWKDPPKSYNNEKVFGS